AASSPAATAASSAQVRPSSKKESRVRLTMPITSTRREVSGSGRGVLGTVAAVGPEPASSVGPDLRDTVESARGGRPAAPSSSLLFMVRPSAVQVGAPRLRAAPRPALRYGRAPTCTIRLWPHRYAEIGRAHV